MPRIKNKKQQAADCADPNCQGCEPPAGPNTAAAGPSVGNSAQGAGCPDPACEGCMGSGLNKENSILSRLQGIPKELRTGRMNTLLQAHELVATVYTLPSSKKGEDHQACSCCTGTLNEQVHHQLQFVHVMANTIKAQYLSDCVVPYNMLLHGVVVPNAEQCEEHLDDALDSLLNSHLEFDRAFGLSTILIVTLNSAKVISRALRKCSCNLRPVDIVSNDYQDMLISKLGLLFHQMDSRNWQCFDQVTELLGQHKPTSGKAQEVYTARLARLQKLSRSLMENEEQWAQRLSAFGTSLLVHEFKWFLLEAYRSCVSWSFGSDPDKYPMMLAAREAQLLLKPSSARAYKEVGFLHLQMGEHQKAWDYLSMALALARVQHDELYRAAACWLLAFCIIHGLPHKHESFLVLDVALLVDEARACEECLDVYGCRHLTTMVISCRQQVLLKWAEIAQLPLDQSQPCSQMPAPDELIYYSPNLPEIQDDTSIDASDMTVKQCSYCLRHFPKVMSCALCKSSHYCSKPCQTAHWKAHKERCAAVRAGTAAPPTNLHLTPICPDRDASIPPAHDASASASLSLHTSNSSPAATANVRNWYVTQSARETSGQAEPSSEEVMPPGIGSSSTPASRTAIAARRKKKPVSKAVHSSAHGTTPADNAGLGFAESIGSLPSAPNQSQDSANGPLVPTSSHSPDASSQRQAEASTPQADLPDPTDTEQHLPIANGTVSAQEIPETNEAAPAGDQPRDAIDMLLDALDEMELEVFNVVGDEDTSTPRWIPPTLAEQPSGDASAADDTLQPGSHGLDIQGTPTQDAALRSEGQHVPAEQGSTQQPINPKAHDASPCRQDSESADHTVTAPDSSVGGLESLALAVAPASPAAETDKATAPAGDGSQSQAPQPGLAPEFSAVATPVLVRESADAGQTAAGPGSDGVFVFSGGASNVAAVSGATPGSGKGGRRKKAGLHA